MNKKTWLGIGIVVVIITVIFTQMKHPVKSGKSIKIGAALALSGDAAAWGEQERHGIDLALKDLASDNIDIVYADTFSTSKGTISAVQKLISMDGVKYIVGPTWLDTYPGSQNLIKGTDVMMVTPSANATTIQEPQVLPNLYSFWYRTEHDANMFAKIIRDSGKKTVSILALNDAYFVTFIDLLKKQLENTDVKVISTEYVNYGSDPKPTLEKQYVLKPEAVLVASYDPVVANKAYQYINQRYDASILKMATNIKEYLASDSNQTSLVNGYYFIKAKAADERFIERYENAFGLKPDFSASQAYDAVMFLAKTIKLGKVPVSFDTASFGTITFDEVHGITSNKQLYDVYKVIDGKEVLQ